MKYKLYYCKSRKKTGDPIVLEYENGERLFYNTFVRDYGNIKLKMRFGNAKGKAKKSGATTVLEVEVL
jgi:hypothetical protein